jgi:hypothetical protein
MSGLRHSGELYLEFLRFLVYGPTGEGKTTLAATKSKYWKGRTRQKKRVELQDMVWISCDSNATECLEGLNYRVREYRLRDDLLRYPRKGEKKLTFTDPFAAMAHIMSGVQRLAMNDEISTVVLDTASALNSEFIGHLANKDEEAQKLGAKPMDGRRFWGQILQWEKATFGKLMKMPCHVVILCHEKQIIDYGDTTASDKKMHALTPSGKHEFQPAISGSALGDYYRDMSLGMVLLSSLNTRTKQRDRYLSLACSGGHIGKNRYVDILDDKEEADLGKLTKKLQQTKGK